MAKDELADKLVIQKLIETICVSLEAIDSEVAFHEIGRVNVNEEGHPWRRWFLAQIVIEIKKAIASISIHKDCDLLRIESPRVAKHSLIRRMQYDAATVVSRKLKEVFSRVILMQGCLSDDFCLLYILAEEIGLKRATIEENMELFEVTSSMLALQLSKLESSFERVLRRVDQSKITFLAGKCGSFKPKLLLEKQFILSAMAKASPAERMVLGYFYSGYKLQSGRVHASFGVTATRDVNQNTEVLINQCIALMHILKRVAFTLKCESHHSLKELSRYLERGTLERSCATVTRGDAKVGDVVEVMAHLAKVIEVKNGPEPLKYRAFRVEYYGEPPVIGVKEEFLAAWEVNKIISADELRKLVSKKLKYIYPGKIFGKRLISKGIDRLLNEIKFSKSGAGDLYLVGSERSYKIFKDLFSRSNLKSDRLILRAFENL